MPDEAKPVDVAEFVYRRIHRSHFDRNLSIPVLRVAFAPNANDVTGLSVFRALLVSPVGTLGNINPAKRGDYFVARLSVSAFTQLGLTVIPDPVPSGPAGHALIPELSYAACQADKRRAKEIQVELAKLASAALVYEPPKPSASEN